MTRIVTYIAEESDAQKRLDIFLSERIEETTRSVVKRLIEDGLVKIDGVLASKSSYRLKTGEEVEVKLPPERTEDISAEDIALDIVYEDDLIIAVNKDSGMAVHPGAGISRGTLAAALLHHSGRLSTVGGASRPGIVHRLDKETTGIIIAAKDDKTHLNLSTQFKERTVKKIYHALVWGRVKEDSGKVDMPIGRCVSNRKKISPRTNKAKEAVTCFSVLKRYSFFTLLELRPETGRTHQLRVHMNEINHPIVGDKLYGRRRVHQAVPKTIADMIKGITGQLLHALSLQLKDPATGREITLAAPYPEEMTAIIGELDIDADK